MTSLIGALWGSLIALGSTTSHDAGKWTLIDEDEGIRAFKQEIPDSRTVAFRGEATLPMSPMRILSIMSNIDRYTEWNRNIKKVVLLERKSISERIQYMETFVPFPYQNREVVVRITTRWNPDEKAIEVTSHSVDDPRAPTDTGCVRAKVIFTRYFLRPSPDWMSTQMTIEIHADPMGNIPGWLVNIFQKGWHRKTFQALTQRAKDPTVQNNPEIRKFIESEGKRLRVKLPALEEIDALENGRTGGI
jgi:hypothetical protein